MTQDLSVALLDAYVRMAMALHKNGSLSLSDLTNELGDAIDFRRRTGVAEPDMAWSVAIYQAVQMAEKNQALIDSAKAARDAASPKQSPDPQ